MESFTIVSPMEHDQEQPNREVDDKTVTNSNDSCSDSQENLDSESKQMILIKLVSQEPAIFNSKHPDYRNNARKDELWLEMSKQVGWPDTYCKNKWKAVRDQFCRELKRTRNNPNVRIKWKYFQHLEFLSPYALSRNYRTKIKNENESSDSQTFYQEESSYNTQDDTIQTEYFDDSELKATIKTEQWTMCESSDVLNDSGDITSQIMMQLADPIRCKKLEAAEGDGLLPESQDDDDDDPIHTFLNIESYFEKELIALVQRKAIIYNTAHPFYRNAKIKLKVWEEIARKLKKPVSQCRSKWKAFRDQYIREHKRLRNYGHCKSLPRWKHYDDLCFLESFIKERNTDGVEIRNSKMQEPELTLGQEMNESVSNNTDTNDVSSFNVMEDDETTGMYTECLYSPQQSTAEQPKSECSQNEKVNHLVVEKVTEITEAQSSSNNDESDDEVGVFFKAVAMKIRKANMSSVAFTDLQIDILKVITNALKN